MLRESGDLLGDPRPITHAVKFYEKGDRPLEIITSRQWFIRTMEYRERAARAWVARSSGIRPTCRRGSRTGSTASNGDWCVSRQRFFGVPFPVWYKVRDDGSVDHDARLLPDESQLPMDPSTDVPAGYTPDSAISPAGSPAIRTSWTPGRRPRCRRRSSARWDEDDDLFSRVFPMDLRPQAHDIIRTWLFSTLLRSELEHGALPVAQRRDLRLGARSRSQEDVEVEGQRRHADGAARGAWIRRRALLGGERPPGTDTAFDPAR